MKFSCFKCGQRLAAETDMIGRQVDCPVCGSKITVVGEVVESPVAASLPPPAAATAAAPAAAPAGPMAKSEVPPSKPAPPTSAPASPPSKPSPSAPPSPINKPAPAPGASSTPPGRSVVSAALAAAAAEAGAAVTAAATAPAAKPAAAAAASKPATPAAKPAAPKRPASKSRAPVVAMVVVLIAALAGGGWYLWRGKFSGRRPPVKESPITGKPSDPPAELTVAWKAGQRYQMSLDMNQTCGYRIRSNTAPMETVFTQDYAVNVTSGDGGNRNLELEILGFTLETTSGGRIVMNFDSLNKAASSEGNAVAQSLGKLVGGRVRYEVSPENKILSTDGVKDLVARAASATASTTPTRAVIVARRHFNTDGLKQMIELGAPPPGPVRIGTQWTVERDINAGIHGTFRLVTTNTFAGWQLRDRVNCARINITGTLSATTVTGLGPAASAVGSMKISNGKLTGKSWINPTLGLPVETIFDATYDAPVIVPPSRRDPTAETISTTISPARQSLSIKLTEVSSPPKP